MIIASLLFILTLLKLHDTCPPPISLSSLNLPPPVVHTECLRQNPCQSGYICRRYRCVSSRALASKSFRFYKESKQMEQCCANNSLPRRCNRFCSLNSYNESAVFHFLSEPNRCPLTALRTIHFCASRNRDHTTCCQRKLIPADCLDLCRPYDPETNFGESKLHCLQFISVIKSCFRD